VWLLGLVFSLNVGVSYQVPLLLFLAQLGIVGNRFHITGSVQAQVGKRSRLLANYSKLLAHFERYEVSATYLAQLQASLKHENTTAGEAIEQLGNLTELLDQRLNIFAGILLNGTLMWDIRIVRNLEKWKQAYGDKLFTWLETLAELDYLVSLSRWVYNHPTYVWPEWKRDTPGVIGKELGHPLLSADTRVDNDLSLPEPGTFWLITGANMAGKSTYLRTVGVNMVLAMAGAPVCASSFHMTPMPVLTSMRNTDSLASHTSFFMAELQRLKHIVDQLKQAKCAFIIVDEMLRGTNSQDKHTGSKRYIEQLIQLNGIGLVATHDLSLGALENEYPGQVVNKRFEIAIEGDQLTFDYLLQDGVSQNLNATYLMEKMGIMA